MEISAKVILLFLLPLSTAIYASSSNDKPTLNHDLYMKKLIELAHENPNAPFAAMIVETKTGKVLCEGLNDSANNPTYHGEMVAINHCASSHPTMNWSEATLYTTAEPCPMCESAIIWAGISSVVYGTSIPTLKQLGWDQIDIRAKSVVEKAAFYHGTILGDILSAETNKLFVRTHVL